MPREKIRAALTRTERQGSSARADVRPAHLSLLHIVARVPDELCSPGLRTAHPAAAAGNATARSRRAALPSSRSQGSHRAETLPALCLQPAECGETYFLGGAMESLAALAT